MSVLSLEVSFLSFSVEGHFFFFLISVTWLSPAPATCGLQSHLPCQDSLDTAGSSLKAPAIDLHCLNFPPDIQLPGLLLDFLCQDHSWCDLCSGYSGKLGNYPGNAAPIQAPQSEHIFAGSLLEAWAQNPAHSGWFVAVPGFRTSDHHSLCKSIYSSPFPAPVCWNIHSVLTASVLVVVRSIFIWFKPVNFCKGKTMNCNVQPLSPPKKVDFMVVGEQTSKGRKRIYFKMGKFEFSCTQNE